MRKPSLHSVRRIIYLNFFWLGFEYFRCQGDTYNGYLPPDEASALSSVADEFKSKVVVLPSSRSYCQQAVSNYGYAINCDDCKGGDNWTGSFKQSTDRDDTSKHRSIGKSSMAVSLVILNI
ncbi:hypothetical protein PanWU01x14_293070 [Parasponia andersonii]|uniref:Uncharacterized protein n=1 Tax=Parasponia andersonii TaxID=3476 RepID=A0A2P5AWS6_PARAD|nr:hypothetical protein PanWU01x14_293070 [Parasponia andersonii]